MSKICKGCGVVLQNENKSLVTILEKMNKEKKIKTMKGYKWKL